MYKTIRTHIGVFASTGVSIRGQKTSFVTLNDVRVRGGSIVNPSKMGASVRSLIDAASVSEGKTSVSKVHKAVLPSPTRSMHMRYRYTAPAAPSLPSFSATGSLTSYIKGLYSAYIGISASIVADRQPFLFAYIYGYNRLVLDLSALIYVKQIGTGTLYSSIRGILYTHTSPLEYERTVLSTYAGVSIVYRQTTVLPDLTASIRGWYYSDLGASIYPNSIHSFDLMATISSHGAISTDFYASVRAMSYGVLAGTISAITPSTLLGYMTTIPPSNIISTVTAIPPSVLYATSGGHLPVNLYAVLQTVQPYPLYAYIVSGYGGVSSLTAAVTGVGGFSDLNARIKTFYGSSTDIRATIGISWWHDIPCFITGWQYLSLYASIAGIYSTDIGGYINPIVTGLHVDLSGFIRSAYDNILSLGSSIHGWIAAHTTNKPYSFDFKDRLPSFMLSTEGGASLVHVELVRGVFPDLLASIYGDGFKNVALGGFIRSFLPSTSLFSSSIIGVTSPVHIGRLSLHFYPLSDLYASISTNSRIEQMYAFIRGYKSTHTATDSSSFWVRGFMGHRAIFGTAYGIYLYSPVVGNSDYLYFNNISNIPDLHAYIGGWAQASLIASISSVKFSTLASTITILDATHMLMLRAKITAYSYTAMSANINSVGTFVSFYGSIISSGETSLLSASIYPYISPKAFRIIAVETQPLLSLYATIGAVNTCSLTSTFSSLSAYIQGRYSSAYDVGVGVLYASIFTNTDTGSINASIEGKRLIRYSIIPFIARTMNFTGYNLSAHICGVGNTASNFTATITGDYLYSSINSTVTAVRYYLNVAKPIGTFDVYKEEGQFVSLYKTIKLSMSSAALSYVYDDLDKVVYPTKNGKWVLKLETYTGIDKALADRDTEDRYVEIGSMVKYNTVDEAIRAAVVLLIGMRSSSMTASIASVGNTNSMGAYIYGISSDKTSQLNASLYITKNEPTLAAYLNAVGKWMGVPAYINGFANTSRQVTASIAGHAVSGMSAFISGVV